VQAREAGLIDEGHLAGELGEVAAGRAVGRAGPEELTLFKSVGNAAQDLAVGALALARAAELGLGVEVDL
jgi:ornithine cyclodeaminase